MARTRYILITLNSKAPSFTLPDLVSGETKSLSQLQGNNGTFILFICNHCPFVIHVMAKLVELSKEYQTKGINFIAINSNDINNYPDDAPDKMTLFAKKYDFDFPYLFDESQKVAKTYDAACTPDFYLYNNTLELIYRGQLDASRPDNGITNDGKNIIEAFDHLLSGKMPIENQIPSLGCNIKWK
jgi:peroxiredoxin